MLNNENESAREPELPIYRKLALSLATDIKAGQYKIGALIPSIGENSKLQGLSIPTIAAAYDLLKKHGIIGLNVSNRYAVKSKNIERFLAEELKKTRQARSQDK